MNRGYTGQCTTVYSDQLCGCDQGSNWVSYLKKQLPFSKILVLTQLAVLTNIS